MKKFKAVNKRNGKDFVVTMMEDKAIVREVGTDKEKENSLATIKRWYELGEEIKPEVKKAPKKKATKKAAAKKKSGVDKRKKVTEEQVIAMREMRAEGISIGKIAKEFGMSYSGAYWIVNGNTWANLDKKAN